METESITISENITNTYFTGLTLERREILESDESINNRFASRMNIIRFLAICSIVWGHSTYALEQHVFHNWTDQLFQSFLLQSGKVGTVLFFLISGFFLAGQIGRFNVIGYLRYRWFSLITPWFIFLSLLTLVQTYNTISSAHSSTLNYKQIITVIFIYYKASIFHAAYWFIPVAVLSSIILIALKKYVNAIWLGLLLAGITLFYSINLHNGWVSTSHTRAFFGYAFFMWLGVQLKNNSVMVERYISKTSWALLLSLIGLSFIIACLEGIQLSYSKCADPYASIRLSNIVFCIILFIALLKSARMQWINALKPQQYVYGIYLVHCVIVTMLLSGFDNYIIQHQLFAHLPKLFIIQGLFFFAVLGVTFGIVVLLKHSLLSVLIGRKYNSKKNILLSAQKPTNYYRTKEYSLTMSVN